MRRTVTAASVLAWPLAIALSVVACTSQAHHEASSSPSPSHSVAATRTHSPSPGKCHYRGTGLTALPDKSCTPGATDPAVTQANIHSTICVAGYTAKVRPPLSVTSKIKTQSLHDYGVGPASAYELDHLVPLELGGAPADTKNLWVELNYSNGPHPTNYDHNPKDVLEFVLRNKVCAKTPTITLAQAQQDLESNWVTTYVKVLGRQPS